MYIRPLLEEICLGKDKTQHKRSIRQERLKARKFRNARQILDLVKPEKSGLAHKKPKKNKGRHPILQFPVQLISSLFQKSGGKLPARGGGSFPCFFCTRYHEYARVVGYIPKTTLISKPRICYSSRLHTKNHSNL